MELLVADPSKNMQFKCGLARFIELLGVALTEEPADKPLNLIHQIFYFLCT